MITDFDPNHVLSNNLPLGKDPLSRLLYSQWRTLGTLACLDALEEVKEIAANYSQPSFIPVYMFWSSILFRGNTPPEVEPYKHLWFDFVDEKIEKLLDEGADSLVCKEMTKQVNVIINRAFGNRRLLR